MAMNDQNRLSPDELEALFQAARDHPPAPGPALLARVLAEAAAHQPPPRQAAAPRRRFVAANGRRQAPLRGWPALLGLSAAAAFGVWIGYAHPVLAPFAPGAGALAGSGAAGFELEDFEPRYPDFSLLLEEI